MTFGFHDCLHFFFVPLIVSVIGTGKVFILISPCKRGFCGQVH